MTIQEIIKQNPDSKHTFTNQDQIKEWLVNNAFDINNFESEESTDLNKKSTTLKFINLEEHVVLVFHDGNRFMLNFVPVIERSRQEIIQSFFDNFKDYIKGVSID